MILLFSVLNDEQRALVERIFHGHHIHFQRISFNIVKSEEAAEDVVSTAFIKIMDNIEKISDLPCPQMTAFCVTIVKNASIDVLRQLQQSVHIDYWDNISDEDTDDIEDECIHNADVHRLTEVIDQLNPDDRHFIYLRYTLEMGYREIGELLNISEDAAKKRISIRTTVNTQETEKFFQMKNAKGRFRFYRELLSTSMGLSSEQVISDASLNRACKIAMKDYLRTELKEDAAVSSTGKSRTHIVFRRFGKAVAVAAITITLLFSTAMVTNAKIREKVIAWIVETFEKYSIFELQSDGENTKPDLQSYKPTYLPDGAELKNTVEQPEMLAYEYAINESSYFNILLSKSDTRIYADAENTEIESFDKDGVIGYYFKKDDLNYICYERDGDFFSIYGSIDMDELIKIAAGITTE